MSKTIAHYTDIATLLRYILPGMKLKFSSLSKTNDPYEMYMDWHLGRSAFSSSADESFGILDSNSKIRDSSLKNCKIACFCGSTLYPCDVNEVGNNDFLWTYYASAKTGANSGCAILFDKDLLLKSIVDSNYSIIFSDQIKYVETSKLNSIGRIDFIEAISKKDIKWEKESEYRIVVQTESSDEIFIDISDSINGLVLPAKEIDGLSDKFKKFLKTVIGNDKIHRRYYDASIFMFKTNNLF